MRRRRPGLARALVAGSPIEERSQRGKATYYYQNGQTQRLCCPGGEEPFWLCLKLVLQRPPRARAARV